MRATSGASSVFGFTGEQFDSETGFTFLRARYLDPSAHYVGIVSRDPVTMAM